MGQKDNHVMEKEQRREAKQDLVVLMHQESPGKRQKPLWEFTSADPLPIAGCKECSHGERPRSSIGDMGIQLNCEKPYSNGWLRPAAPIHRCRAVRCKPRYKNSSTSTSVLGTSIASVVSWALRITGGAQKKNSIRPPAPPA